MKRRLYLVLILFPALAGVGLCSWQNIKTFDEPVSCGYFFDSNHGLIGCGQFTGNTAQSAFIYKTTDGGASWQQSFTPPSTGMRVTSIFMQDSLVGFASIMAIDFIQTCPYLIWKTTDGGKNWQDFSQSDATGSTCVYATSKAITITSWNRTGGSSVDNGATYSPSFRGEYDNESNGIDFLDDLHGVVTMGPDNQKNPPSQSIAVTTYVTSDGGVSWNRGGFMRESWSVYASRATNSYFAMAEDFAGDPGSSIYVSFDNTASWVEAHRFTDLKLGTYFTGHVGGSGNTLYVQTYESLPNGFYRSDDNALTWKPVGGPTGSRDTRFCVTGCNGQTVYAFDVLGNVWKTTDGGDGTLSGTASSGSPISFINNSISLHTLNCQPDTISLAFLNLNCSAFTIDTVLFGGLGGHITMLHSAAHDKIGNLSPDSITLVYQSDTDEVRTISIRIEGTAGTLSVDTTVFIAISNSITTPPLTLAFDSLLANLHYCQSDTFAFPIFAASCAPFIIDSIISLDSSGEISFIHSPPNNMITGGNNDSIVFAVASSSEEDRIVRFRLVGEAFGKTVDTMLTVHLSNIFSPSNGPKLLLANDSAVIETHFCQPGTLVIPIVNINCSPMTISVVKVSDTTGYSTIVYSPQGNVVSPFAGDSIAIRFQSDSNIQLEIPLRLQCSIAGESFDTTIEILASHSRSPEPYLAQPQAVKAGDTTFLSVMISPPTDPINISHLAFHLSYNGDLLNALPNVWISTNTLSAEHNAITIQADRENGIDCSIDFKTPITNSSDFSEPVISLGFRATLTEIDSSIIALDSFGISSDVPLSLCSTPQTVFRLVPQCGDSILNEFMRTGIAPRISGITPNPARNSITVSYDLAGATQTKMQVIDLLGNIISEQSLITNTSSVTIAASALSASTYYLRMISSGGSVASASFVIEK